MTLANGRKVGLVFAIESNTCAINVDEMEQQQSWRGIYTLPSCRHKAVNAKNALQWARALASDQPDGFHETNDPSTWNASTQASHHTHLYQHNFQAFNQQVRLSA
ncbi:hypothetical protein HYFRA_00012941 [Hymenoscyphus fraxineus]|uniref:Uncharacterized protein n=1 Tax=Hymenoscyphus fraxineus TaxID=746836 RepID=A0A9N9L4I0_9HELO|nr:hypothetical protein HYFRA_00012941 [Hymenoscyphus fraxineus]